ncbi:MAG TPA: hypothetical protein VFC51_12255 [Chloroflexota bacterium]|nr:hypothetical protein [Chloroflexota bacterium]
MKPLIAGLVVGCLAIGTTAVAKDFCINVPDLGITYVGKGFRIPGKGRCKGFDGILLSADHLRVGGGTACTASDGSHVTFNFALIRAEANYLSTNASSADLSLPSLTGMSFGPYGAVGYAATGGTCPSTATVP